LPKGGGIRPAEALYKVAGDDIQLTADDLELLRFAGEHRFVLSAHVQALLRLSAEAAEARLRELCDAGLLAERTVFAGFPPTYRSTRRGLDAVGSKLRAPTIDVGRYDHEVGAAWLWLAARNGAFGPMREVLGERQLRSRDAAAAQGPGSAQPLAVRLGGLGRSGRPRLHHPDLLLVDRAGRRLAVELELTSKSRERRERILAGYAADGRIAGVLYVVQSPRLAESIHTSARRLGISHLVAVQQVRWAQDAPRAADLAASRPAGREHAATRRWVRQRRPAATAGVEL
jgi:hypothetical protein